MQGMLAGGVSGAPVAQRHRRLHQHQCRGHEFHPAPDLNARWAEMQAFGVVMRTRTNRPSMNQQVYDTPTTRAQFARASQIYAALYDHRRP